MEKYTLILFCVLIITIILVKKMESASIGAQNRADFPVLTKSYGFPFETHDVETEDGYILTIFRIPYGCNSTSKKPNSHPIILNHGLMGSAENFIIGGPNKALSFVLPNKGYDVWLINARGTYHSRKHRYLDPDTDMEKYWKFSFHEIGYYDLPATIDYILNITQKTKLSFIGHSQGTTTFFVMGSERPEYNEKISVMLAMAPSAILGNIKVPGLQLIAPSYQYLQFLIETLKVYEIVPRRFITGQAIKEIGASFCDDQAVTKVLCLTMMTAMTGFSQEQLDPEMAGFIASVGPGGGSLYQLLHYAQLVNSGQFIKYDWGPEQNKIKYNSSQPPLYKLENVKAPISLLYGEADMLVTKEDVAILATYLPNIIDIYKVPYENWSHMDFLWAKDIDKLLNKHIFRILNKFA